MKKAKYYMTFYKDIALLHSICNKQTLFFAEMVSRMDSDQMVQMTPYIRKQIIDVIGVKSTDKLAAARQYLSKLADSNLIANNNDGAYMVNPKIHGHNNFLNAIEKKTEIFLKIKYSKSGKRVSISAELGDE